MSKYENALDRMQKFAERLPSTNIEFLFFESNNAPSYRNEFKVYTYDRNTYYISQGNSKNYLYVYRESDIKYLVSVLGKKKTHPVTIFDVDVISQRGFEQLRLVSIVPIKAL